MLPLTIHLHPSSSCLSGQPIYKLSIYLERPISMEGTNSFLFLDSTRRDEKNSADTTVDSEKKTPSRRRRRRRLGHPSLSHFLGGCNEREVNELVAGYWNYLSSFRSPSSSVVDKVRGFVLPVNSKPFIISSRAEGGAAGEGGRWVIRTVGG